MLQGDKYRPVLVCVCVCVCVCVRARARAYVHTHGMLRNILSPNDDAISASRF